MDNTAKGSANLEQGGSILHISKRGDHKDASANEGASVLDIPGELETSRQKRGAPEGTSGKRTICQAGMMDFPESLAGKQVATGQGRGEDISALLAFDHNK